MRYDTDREAHMASAAPAADDSRSTYRGRHRTHHRFLALHHRPDSDRIAVGAAQRHCVGAGLGSYPFILLNLMFSVQAAYSAPFIMMSQNRQAERDRLQAQADLDTDVKAELEIKDMLGRLESIEHSLGRIEADLARVLRPAESTD